MDFLKRLLLVVGLLALVVCVGIGFLAFSFLETHASSDEQALVFEVRPGDSFKTTASRLEQAGLISSATKFEIYGRLTGLAKKVRVGEYAIRKDARPRDVVTVITSGHSIEYVITVSEGLNKFEIAELVAKQKIATRDEFLKTRR